VGGHVADRFTSSAGHVTGGCGEEGVAGGVPTGADELEEVDDKGGGLFVGLVVNDGARVSCSAPDDAVLPQDPEL
jgi:hypothetical protein